MNIKKFILTLITCLSLICQAGANSEKPIFEQFQVKYLKTQYAGNFGLMSIGVGKTFFTNKLSVDFNFGYLPKHGNGEQVFTLALKPAYYFYKTSILKIRSDFYGGITLAYSITNNTYFMYPKYYPKGYYDLSNAIHLYPFVGVAFPIPVYSNKASAIVLFTELGTVDYLIWNDVRNKKINKNEIWNICFGFAIAL